MAHGIKTIVFRGWSGNVSGVANALANRKHSDWDAGGAALGYKLESLPPHERIVIAHSHGGNCAGYCAAPSAQGPPVYIHRLLTICTPARGDMAPVWSEAHKHIGAHRHISAKGWDFWQRLGELGDLHFGWTRKIEGAENVFLDGIGHTGLIEEPKHFHYLTERAGDTTPTVDFLKEQPAANVTARARLYSSPGD